MSERRVLTGDARAQERRFILDGAFPHFPLLPVIRDAEDGSEHGIIAWRYVEPGQEGTAGPWRVHLGNLYDLGERAEKLKEEGVERPTIKQVLEGFPTEVYSNLDVFLDAGWRAD